MKGKLFALLGAVLLLSLVSVLGAYYGYSGQYRQPYQDFNTYFSQRYAAPSTMSQDRFMPYAQQTGNYGYAQYYPQYDQYYGQQSDQQYYNQQTYYYVPYPLGPITQKSYYRIEDQPIDIEPNSYEDGYNKGYYLGYYDGQYFQKYGYEGYMDYKANFEEITSDTPTTGYYVINERKVEISARKVVNDYDRGYNSGVSSGFRDGFYGIEYKGLNEDYYAFQLFQEKFPGRYVPLSQPQKYNYPTYRTFPGLSSFNMGSYYYGFNYYK
ncbi:MAG: hypothetical protein V1743_04535 [Nanoarchaeota archaeon]